MIHMLRVARARGCTAFCFKLDALLHAIQLEVGAENIGQYSDRVISCTSDQGDLIKSMAVHISVLVSLDRDYFGLCISQARRGSWE